MKNTKRTSISLSLGEASNAKKVSLNTKVSAEIDKKLKIARALARANGKKFNVSEHVEAHLTQILGMFEESLKVNLDDYEMIDNKVEKKTS